MPFIKKTVYSDPSVDYLNYAHDLRGRVINQISEMERAIDTYISRHFCDSKGKATELAEIIISTSHLTFKSKADIAKYLLIKRGDATKAVANKIHNHLVDNIAKNRNIIAHNTLLHTASVLRSFKTDKLKTVYFVKFSNEKKEIAFTQTDAQKLLKLSFSIKLYFNGLIYNKTKTT